MTSRQISKILLPLRRADLRVVSLSLFSVLVLIGAVRWRTGTDWSAYKEIYGNANSFPFLNSYFEPIYVLLIRSLSLLSESFSLYILAISLLTTGIKGYAIASFRYPLFGILWFGVTFQFNLFAVRYDVALSIVLVAITFCSLQTNRRFLTILLAAGIHKIGVLAIGLELLYMRAKGRSIWLLKLFFLCACALVVVYYVTQDSFLYKLSTGVYGFELRELSEIGVKFLHRIWYFALILWLRKCAVPNEKERVYLDVILVGALFYLLIGVVDIGSLERVFGLFLIYELYLLSNVKIKQRTIYILVFSLTMFPIRLYQFFFSDYADLFFPYETIFETSFKEVY